MFEVRIRQVMGGGELCQIDGCEVPRGEDLVMFSVNEGPPLAMSGLCAAAVGDTLMAEARHVDLRKQRRQAGESLEPTG